MGTHDKLTTGAAHCRSFHDSAFHESTLTREKSTFDPFQAPVRGDNEKKSDVSVIANREHHPFVLLYCSTRIITVQTE